MGTNIPFGTISAREIERISSQCPEGNVRVPQFNKVAKVLWPFKTAAQLATIAGTTERAAARWLSGEVDPPNAVVLATMQKIFGQE